MKIEPHDAMDWCHLCGIRSTGNADVFYSTNAEHDPDVDESNYLRVCGSCASCVANAATGRGPLPPALEKATVDPFDYAAMLVTGMVIYFSEAKCTGDGWVCLKEISRVDWPSLKTAAKDSVFADKTPPFERDMDVCISHIVWVCDAPFGS